MVRRRGRPARSQIKMFKGLKELTRRNGKEEPGQTKKGTARDY